MGRTGWAGSLARREFSTASTSIRTKPYSRGRSAVPSITVSPDAARRFQSRCEQIGRHLLESQNVKPEKIAERAWGTGTTLTSWSSLQRADGDAHAALERGKVDGIDWSPSCREGRRSRFSASYVSRCCTCERSPSLASISHWGGHGSILTARGTAPGTQRQRPPRPGRSAPAAGDDAGQRRGGTQVGGISRMASKWATTSRNTISGQYR